MTDTRSSEDIQLKFNIALIKIHFKIFNNLAINTSSISRIILSIRNELGTSEIQSQLDA